MALGKLIGLLRAAVPDRVRTERVNRRLIAEHGFVIAARDEPITIKSSSLGRHIRLSPPVFIDHCTLGDYSYLEPYCRLSATDIGKFCSIAPYCVIGPPSHPLDRVSCHPAFYVHNPRLRYTFVDTSDDPSAGVRTTIGNDVWLGASVLVRRGVTIGDGAVVGGGSVVVKDVPPYAIVAGVPAKTIRYRFDQPTIDRLLALRWWDRDESWLRANAADFPHVQRILEREG